MNSIDFLKEAKQIENEILENQRYLHENAEVGFELQKTTEYVKNKLEKLGCEVTPCGKNGLVTLIGKGKGNEEWNYSAPHGAGRICSRAESKELFTVNEFKKEMKGVYSENINSAGLSEAPMVYKKREYIIESLKELVEIEDILTPVFNYKN